MSGKTKEGGGDVPHDDIHQRASLLCSHQPSILKSPPSHKSSTFALHSSSDSVDGDPGRGRGVAELPDVRKEGWKGRGRRSQTKVLTFSFLFFFFKTTVGCGCVACCWRERLDLVVLGTLPESPFKCFKAPVVLAAMMAMGGKEFEATCVEELGRTWWGCFC
jgi:hypothetical protein